MTDVKVKELHECQHCPYDTQDEAEMCIHMEREHDTPQVEIEVEAL